MGNAAKYCRVALCPLTACPVSLVDSLRGSEDLPEMGSAG